MSEQVEKALSGLMQLRARWISNVAGQHCGCSECDAIRLCASEVDEQITLLRTRLEKVVETGQGLVNALDWYAGKYGLGPAKLMAALEQARAALEELAGKGEK